MTTERNRNRIQLFLNETHKEILNQLRQEKGWNENGMPDKEMLKYIILDYQRLSEDYKHLEEKLRYMDQNISILVNLVSSMAMEYHIQSYPLEESLPYFQARKQVESMMNLPRAIKPSPAIQKELQQPTKVFHETLLEKESSETPKVKPKKELNDRVSTSYGYEFESKPQEKIDDDDMPNVFLDNDDDMPNVFL